MTKIGIKISGNWDDSKQKVTNTKTKKNFVQVHSTPAFLQSNV